VELLTRGEVSKASNSILNSATFLFIYIFTSMFITCYFFYYLFNQSKLVNRRTKDIVQVVLSCN